MIRKYLANPFRLNTYAAIAEKILLKRKFHFSAKQLFILGLPRTGTTLIYQYIVTRLKVAYFTNGVGRFPGAPCLTTFVENKVYAQYKSDFKSSYGKVLGLRAPREAGAFWGRFFDLDRYSSVSDLTPRDIDVLRRTIACVSNIFGDVPFVNKNVKHLLRLQALSQVFPNSKFLIVDRGLSDVALSILRARYENLHNPTQWWSVRPPDYEELKSLPVVDQVAHQCISLKKKMEEDLMHLPKDRVIRIQYEDFCNNPEHFITGLRTQFVADETENSTQLSFPISHNQAQNQEEILLLNKINEFREKVNEPS